MLKNIKKIDTFSKNMILVFAGTSLVNIFNLFYQLLIAHRLSSVDFAAFNSLLSIFMLISAPAVPLQAVIAKYTAELNVRHEISKIKVLLSRFLKIVSVLAICTFFIFYFTSFHIMDKLKIHSLYSGNILAIMLALSWVTPIFSGALQGLELFKWLMSVSVITGFLKLAFAFIFILMGFNVAGALGALLVSSLAIYILSFFPLKDFLSFKNIQRDNINFKEILIYWFPVAISYLCFIGITTSDMVLVKYFFMPEDSGLYSLAQMVGKIFLFLPGAISIVMFPRVSGLNAKNMNTSHTLNKSLLYAAILCVFTGLLYNIFPSFALKILTGKIFPESIILGRLFSVSMTFFTLLFILITYFLSLKDLRFIKYLVAFTLLQVGAILLFHKSLIQIQLILCINAILLFLIHLILVSRKEIIPVTGGY